MTLSEENASLRERINELEADRSIKMNGSRRFAQYVIDHSCKKSARHNDVYWELINAAKQHIKDGRTIPATTPWLIQMMEVARRDINGLPQQVFQLKEEVERLKRDIVELEDECTDMRMQITDMNEAS